MSVLRVSRAAVLQGYVGPACASVFVMLALPQAHRFQQQGDAILKLVAAAVALIAGFVHFYTSCRWGVVPPSLPAAPIVEPPAGPRAALFSGAVVLPDDATAHVLSYLDWRFGAGLPH